MDEKQSDVVNIAEESPGLFVAVLMFMCLWVVIPGLVFLWRFPDYFNAETNVFSLLVILVPSIVWTVTGGILFSMFYDDYKALHGERIKVPYFQSSSKTLIVDLPEGLQVPESPVTLRRGDHLPEGVTKAVGKMTWDALNVLSVHHIVLGPNLTIVFEVPIDDVGRRMVCSGVADAIWSDLGNPVKFVLRGLPEVSRVMPVKDGSHA